jgi:hypothetical protein
MPVRRTSAVPVGGTLLTLLAGTFAAVGTQPATADTAPSSGPATVSADALPTWQLNGVVTRQIVVGNTVYATGRFSKARPPGARQGHHERAAKNIFAYDIRTGKPVSSFRHSLNAQGLDIERSPDGRRVYVSGDFTKVDGKARGHIAAFDTGTKKLVKGFKPRADRHIKAIAVSANRVYIGGTFHEVNNKLRARLAALTLKGGLTSWAPTADDYGVRTMVISPDKSRVIVGGSFTTLNELPAYGMGSLSASTGDTMPWAANQTIKNGTSSAAITRLRTDGQYVYGAGYTYKNKTDGNFEGTFKADPSTGNLEWVTDCHGDTYDVQPVGQVLYSVGHAHDCSAVGEFPDMYPKAQRALAQPLTADGVNTGPDSYGWNYAGRPAAKHLHWFPNLKTGTFTKQNQAAWSIAATSSYVALGGEFPRVNGRAQQGLVRFALSSKAPDNEGPVSRNMSVAVSSSVPAMARVTWKAQWDMDNTSLVYNVYRRGPDAPNGTATKVDSQTASSHFWDGSRPELSFDDTGLQSGDYTYFVKATDPAGNSVTSSSHKVTVDNPLSR